MSNATTNKAAMKFQVKTLCLIDGQIVETKVKVIRTKTVYAAQRSFKLYAHTTAYTKPKADRTIMGGYYINPETGDALVIEPIK